MSRNYNCTFTVANAPVEVFDSICNVAGWWSANITGNTTDTGDKFTVRFGETWVAFEIAEMIPAQKIVWAVADSHLHGFTEPREWNNTSLSFDITSCEAGTTLSITHIGLTPAVACYENCRSGWDFYAGDSLKALITTGAGKPNTPRAER